jgi:competence protein ComEA
MLTAVGIVHMVRAIGPAGRVEVAGGEDVLPPPQRLDINTAQSHDLQMLPGVGPSTARAIVEHRRTHGTFESIEALQDVRGIGPATLEGIRPHAMCAPVRERR